MAINSNRLRCAMLKCSFYIHLERRYICISPISILKSDVRVTFVCMYVAMEARARGSFVRFDLRYISEDFNKISNINPKFDRIESWGLSAFVLNGKLRYF
jgi:hypothetical protein